MDWGLTLAGFEHRWFCERDAYCRGVLGLRYPGVPIYPDVRGVGYGTEPVDILSGGFPCQPVSLVGPRAKQADERWLWPEFLRAIRLLRPRYALVENVPGLLTAGMGDVLGGLAESGYDAEWDCIPAAAAGAPHLRDRVFLVAYPGSSGRREDTGGALGDEGPNAGRPAQDDHQPTSDGEGGRAGDLAHTNGSGRVGRPRIFGPAGRRELENGGWWATEPDVGRVANGVPRRMDRLRALGNGVVPQVAYWVGRRILEREAVLNGL